MITLEIGKVYQVWYDQSNSWIFKYLGEKEGMIEGAACILDRMNGDHYEEMICLFSKEGIKAIMPRSHTIEEQIAWGNNSIIEHAKSEIERQKLYKQMTKITERCWETCHTRLPWYRRIFG